MRQSDGSVSDWKRSEKPLLELLPHFQERDSFARPAIAEGWRAESPSGVQRVRWSCPDCTRKAG